MIQVAAHAAELAGLNQYLSEFWGAAGLSPESQFPFELALEEVFMNVVMHGSTPEHVPTVEVSLAREGEDVVLSFADTGPPFDPLEAPNPDVEAAIEDRPIGGLGIYLLREMMDEFTYARLHGRNCLTLRKRVS